MGGDETAEGEKYTGLEREIHYPVVLDSLHLCAALSHCDKGISYKACDFVTSVSQTAA